MKKQSKKQRFARGRGKEKKYGHYTSEFWNHSPKHIEGLSNYREEEHTVLLAFKREEVSENIWYIDTCASNHMCGMKNIFMELDESANDQISFDDSSKIPVKEKKVRF